MRDVHIKCISQAPLPAMLRQTMFLAICVLLALFPGSYGVCQEESASQIITQSELQSLTTGSALSASGENPTRRSGLGGMSFLRLLVDGGALMIPIGLMSLLVVAVALERWFALRGNRLFPRRLRREIRRSVEDEAQLSPGELYRTGEHFPSAASRVLHELLSKAGRPITEIETTISEAVQREADRLYANVRWLTLAAAVTPLIGLLGTVWGMIIAFYNTTQLTGGMNRAEYLAEGIYVALVTTLAGLAVAIPAAIFAHYFEGKITKNLGIVDLELRRLVPRLEDFEGRTRFDISPRGFAQRTTPNSVTSTVSAPPGNVVPFGNIPATGVTGGQSATGGHGSNDVSALPVRAPKMKL